MRIVGERINTSRKRMRTAVEERDAAFIQKDAKNQVAAGASLVDVNCGTFVNDEPEQLAWLVDTVQEAVDVPLCMDSPNPKALELALARHRNGQPMINSITDEAVRFDQVLPLVLEHKASIVALSMGDGGMPGSAEERFVTASRIIERLTAAGVPIGDIYVDPVVCPISTDGAHGRHVLDAIRRTMETFVGVHTICGLSNVSFGLPLRQLVNQNFLTMCMAEGLDAVILDPLDGRMMSNLLASEAILGKDDFCMNYMMAHREERLTL
ncbi:MAG: methyltetrahydrofolate cobalamin methyltransferase [Candidatus Latescibacterota bacterium]